MLPHDNPTPKAVAITFCFFLSISLHEAVNVNGIVAQLVFP